MDLVEHAVQPLEDEDEGGSDGLGRPVGDGQHLHDVAPQPAALHGQGVVGGQFQQGVGDLRQPGKHTVYLSSDMEPHNRMNDLRNDTCSQKSCKIAWK